MRYREMQSGARRDRARRWVLPGPRRPGRAAQRRLVGGCARPHAWRRPPDRRRRPLYAHLPRPRPTGVGGARAYLPQGTRRVERRAATDPTPGGLRPRRQARQDHADGRGVLRYRHARRRNGARRLYLRARRSAVIQPRQARGPYHRTFVADGKGALPCGMSPCQESKDG